MRVASAADHSVNRFLYFLRRSFSISTGSLTEPAVGTAAGEELFSNSSADSLLSRYAAWLLSTASTSSSESSLPLPWPLLVRWKDAADSLLSARTRHSLLLSKIVAKEIITASSCNRNKPPSNLCNQCIKMNPKRSFVFYGNHF